MAFYGELVNVYEVIFAAAIIATFFISDRGWVRGVIGQGQCNGSGYFIGIFGFFSIRRLCLQVGMVMGFTDMFKISMMPIP